MSELGCFRIYANNPIQRQQFHFYFRTLNPKFKKNWNKAMAAPALPCLAGEPLNLANWLCLAA